MVFKGILSNDNARGLIINLVVFQLILHDAGMLKMISVTLFNSDFFFDFSPHNFSKQNELFCMFK